MLTRSAAADPAPNPGLEPTRNQLRAADAWACVPGRAQPERGARSRARSSRRRRRGAGPGRPPGGGVRRPPHPHAREAPKAARRGHSEAEPSRGRADSSNGARRGACRSGAGVVYGSFCLVSHGPGVLGAFTYRRHRAHDATRRWWAPGPLRGMVETVRMDGNAAAQDLCAEFQRPRGLTLVTTPRNNRDPTAARQHLINVLHRPPNRRLCQPRGQTVAPMPGVVKDLFALERGGMRGPPPTRWLLAAMGVVVQRHQARALKVHRSPWKITQEALGL